MLSLRKKRTRLGNNARWLLLTEPGWSIPMPWVFYYQPIYMKKLGVNEIELGMLTSLGIGLLIILPFWGSFLGNRIRKEKSVYYH